MVPKVGLARTLAIARRHAGAQTEDAPCLPCFALRPFKPQRYASAFLQNAPSPPKKGARMLLFLVPKVGLEPTRCRQQWILSPSRLPFHHFGLLRYYIIFEEDIASIFFHIRKQEDIVCIVRKKKSFAASIGTAATKKIPLENRRRRRGIATPPRDSRCFYKKRRTI